MKLHVIEEKKPGKVGGVFESEAAAKNAVKSLVSEGAINLQNIELVEPKDRSDHPLGHKIEPEDRGTARALAKSHLVLGVVGLLAGLLLSTVLVTVGPQLTRSNPLFTFIPLTLICVFLGLLLAGLISLRPDHDHLINKSRKMVKSGRWSVVVHTTNTEEKQRAKNVMKKKAAKSVAETI